MSDPSARLSRRLTLRSGVSSLITVGLTVLVLTPGPDGAANAARSAPVLAGRTRVVANTTAGMRVVLPQSATLDAHSGPNRDISIRGSGRMVGLILTAAEVGDYDRQSLEVIRFGFCDGPGCRRRDMSRQYLYRRGGSHDDLELDAGTYLLYAIAEGGPVTVDLRLHGLPGATTLRPRGEVHSELVMPDAENAMRVPGDQAFWFGEEFDIEGQAGYLIGILRMDLASWMNVHWGDCAYDVAPPPRPLAYSPACPGGFNVFQNEGSVLGEGELERPILSEIGSGGRFGYGLYYTAAAEVSNAHAAFMHLSLDPAEL